MSLQDWVLAQEVKEFRWIYRHILNAKKGLSLVVLDIDIARFNLLIKKWEDKMAKWRAVHKKAYDILMKTDGLVMEFSEAFNEGYSVRQVSFNHRPFWKRGRRKR